MIRDIWSDRQRRNTGRAAAFCTDKVCLETDQCAITDSRCRPIMTKLIQIELQCPYGTHYSGGIDL